MGLPHEIIPELNEISWGERRPYTKLRRQCLLCRFVSKWREGETTLQAIGGESPVEVAERQKIAIKRILDNADEN